MKVHTVFRKLSHLQIRFPILALVFFWSLGLSLGVAVALRSQHYTWNHLLILSRALYGWVFVFSYIIPFALSLFAIRFKTYILIFILAFAKSFLYGFVNCLIYNAFGGAGWLMKSLITFSDTYFTVLLLWYWIAGFGKTGQWYFRFITRLSPVVLCICIFDFYFLVPVVARLSSLI